MRESFVSYRLGWAAATDTGRVRDQNEDSLYASEDLFAVADGMGGRLAGEVASALAVEVISRQLESGRPRTLADLRSAAEAANQSIVQAGSRSRSQRGMATTLTGITLVRAAGADQLAVFNVGDSRVYRFADGVLTQLTVDHSAVQEMVAAGLIEADAARTHPRRNVVTRALGSLPAPEVDVQLLPLTQGDRFVICSDGLTNELTDVEIADVLGRSEEPQAAADGLIAQALAAGGSDNVSVIVVDVLG